MLYTGKGDDGTSGFFGSSERCNKDEPLFHALGTVDELNSLLGICYAKARKEVLQGPVAIVESIRTLQEDLFIIQAELAGADKHIVPAQVTHLEEIIGTLEVYIPVSKGFVISGSSEVSAYLDFARSVSRRAERTVLSLNDTYAPGADTCVYLNRLSSVLYALARYVATSNDTSEQNPSY